MALARDLMEYRRGDLGRDRNDLETRERFGWSHLETRARQFRATSSGNDGINCVGVFGSGGSSLELVVAAM